MRSCEKHGAGTENGKSYTVVDMAYWFHNLPHMKFTFLPIDNTMFNFGENQYMKSIIFLAVLTLFVCLMILVVYLICTFLILRLSRNRNSTKKDNKNVKKDQTLEGTKERTGIAIGWKIPIILVAILCGFGFFIGIYGVWKIYVGLAALHNSTRDAVNWFKVIKDDFGEVDPLNVYNFQQLVQNIREEIDSFGLFPNVLNKFTDVLDKIVEYVDKANNQLIKANIPLFNLSRIDVEWIHEDIESYGNIACISLLLVVIILGVVGLLFTCGVFNVYLLAIFTLIAIIGVILNSFLTALGLSVSVLVSDLCVDAKPFIKQELNEWILYQYLVECPLNESPITGILGKAGKLVTTLKEIYGKLFGGLTTLLNTYCKTSESVVNFGIAMVKNIIYDINIPQNMSLTCPMGIRQKVTKNLLDLNSQLSSYTQLINTFKSIADCRRINKDLYDSLDSICGEVNPGFIVIYFYSIFSLILLSVIVFCATFALITSYPKLQENIKKKFNKNKNKK